MHPGQAPEACDCLAPGARVQTIMAWLDSTSVDSVILVAHAPDVGDIASAALTPKGGVDIRFGTATACCLTLENPARLGAGRLEWLVRQDLLHGLLQLAPRSR